MLTLTCVTVWCSASTLPAFWLHWPIAWPNLPHEQTIQQAGQACHTSMNGKALNMNGLNMNGLQSHPGDCMNMNLHDACGDNAPSTELTLSQPPRPPGQPPRPPQSPGKPPRPPLPPGIPPHPGIPPPAPPRPPQPPGQPPKPPQPPGKPPQPPQPVVASFVPSIRRLPVNQEGTQNPAACSVMELPVSEWQVLHQSGI